MNRTQRSLVFVVAFCVAWLLGYAIGQNGRYPAAAQSRAEKRPPAAAEEGVVSGAGLEKFVEGQSEFRKQKNLTSYAATLNAEEMPAAINEALHLTLEHRNAALA